MTRIKLPSKYRAVRTTVCGITFASKKEAHRYLVLKDRLAKKEIFELRLQPEFPLTTCGRHIGFYVADFSYRLTKYPGELIVEDVKGVKTALYRWKKKHMLLEHGITILET